MKEPFVLRGRVLLPPDPLPSNLESYDCDRQLWIDVSSGEPLVTRLASGLSVSGFGETTLTETREGVDQQELAPLQASPFGETIMTKTQEGVDQYEVVEADMSQFGETAISRSHEGVDQSEGVLAGLPFGETVHAATREGVDTSESTSLLDDAAHHYF
jgi:hypothetical protein